MKVKFLILSLLIGSVNALPVKCPSVDEIKNVGLSQNTVMDSTGKWYMGQLSQKYDTEQDWTFVIGGIVAPDKQKAITFANLALSTLNFKEGPILQPSGKYLCLYNNDFDYLSGAITPPIIGFIEYKG